MKPLNPSKYLQEFLHNGKITSIPIIDCHTHMDDIYGCALPISNIEDCRNYLKNGSIQSIWCAPHGDLFSPQSINHDIKQIMNKHSDFVKGYFSFNPNNKEDYLMQINEILENPNYIGIKVLPEYHNTSFDSEEYSEALEFADEHSLIVLVHTWGKSAFNSPLQVENVLKRYKRIQLIMGHSAPNECDYAIRLAKKYENAYLDLCDIHRHSGIVEKMVKEAGSNKVLFGTDLPWYDPNYCIGSILCAKIDDEDRENIFFRNAERMLTNIRKNGDS